MAMSLASPSASPSPSTGDSTANNNANGSTTTATTTTTNGRTQAIKNETNTNEDTTTINNNINNGTSAAPAAAGAATTNGNAQGGVKRKPSRRANTAERRATHNAVERQRRETLNGRFLDLAALLPNLSQIRRPSKSSIVNSSIAHIHASRRHRLLASRELRLVKAESDALRRELNEWRDRAGLPRVEEPVRSEGFGIVVSGELDILMAEVVGEGAGGNLVGMGGGMMDVEEDDELDDWAPQQQHHGQGGQGGYPGGQYEEDVFVPAPPAGAVVHHHQGPPPMQQQQPHMGMMNGPPPPHHGGHPAAHMGGHPAPHPSMHPGVPHPHMQQQGPFGYHHPSQHGGHPQHPGHPQAPPPPPFGVERGGNPFAHNVPRPQGYEGNGAGALFTPPATRDGLPPSGVAGLPNVNPKANGNGAANGGASPAHSVHSVHSVHAGQSPSPQVNVNVVGHEGTPPPLSATSQFSGHGSAHGSAGRSGSGSPVGYEIVPGAGGVGGGNAPNGMERRASYMASGHGGHGHGHGIMMYPTQGGHHQGDMYPMHHGNGHAHQGHQGHQGQMVGAGAGGGLFGMML